MDKYILKPSDYINIGSCVVAIVSAIIAVVSCAIGKKQYKLQVAQMEAGNPQFSVNVNNSILWKKKDSYARYSFNISISNLSDKPTAIKNSLLIIDTLEDAKYVYPEAKLRRGEKDINIMPHNKFTGDFYFDVPWNVYDGINVEKTFLKIEDIHGKMLEKQVIFIEERYEEKDSV